MSFKFPISTSPPATPDKKFSKVDIFSMSNPSTTPAGPPPSSAGSFTPAGPPPTSFLGSSGIGNQSPLKPLSFSQQSAFDPSQSKFNSFNSSTFVPQSSVLGNEYQRRTRSGFQAPEDSDDEEDEEDEEQDSTEYMDQDDNRDRTRTYGDQDADGESDDDAEYENDDDMDDYQTELPGSRSNGHTYHRSSSDESIPMPGALDVLGNSMNGAMVKFNDSLSRGIQPSIFGNIAKGLYTQMGLPEVNEADDVVLNTELIITQLYNEGVETTDIDSLQRSLMGTAGELTQLWAEYNQRTIVYNSEEYAPRIGPASRASDFARANFLASLALRIYHPQIDPNSFTRKRKPMPLILLEWLDEYHDPYPDQLDEVQLHRPSPSNHQLFWSTVFNSLIRGKVQVVAELLRTAGWRHALGEQGTKDTDGFTGQALINVEKVINSTSQLLASSPPVTNGDWNTRGSDWTLFRLKIERAVEDLKNFAEGISGRNEPLGMSVAGLSGTYSTIGKRAQSQLPWHIYQNLLTVYSIMLGDVPSITRGAEDWCEATVGLFVWWNEGRNERRLVLGRSQASSSLEPDSEVYLHRLRKSFESANGEDSEHQVRTVDPVEVALASLFEGDNEAVVGFLRAWSGPISSAIAEISSIGGWLPHPEPQSLMNMGSLDQDDMELLGLNTSPSNADGVKDQTLIAYARTLSHRGQLNSTSTPKIMREGWQLSIALLGRLDTAARSEEMVGEFLKTLRLDSSSIVDKLWILLNDIGMGRHAEKIAQTYADLLAEDSHNYGEALWYYALAHNPAKVKDVLDLLISLSLVQSTAFPPEPELDNHLRRLISYPQEALKEMSEMNIEAAELLHTNLSGYATLRKFYDLRDADILSAQGKKPQKGANARRIDAVTALLAVITSSDDNIRGGLYDENRGAVVSVDFLLALLGEAMVFINQPSSIITVQQISTLLKAVEDLEAVGPRVYSACTEFLQTVIASGQGLKGSTPTDMLRKSTSNQSGISSFSMVGSSMLASQLKQSMSSSGVLVKGNIKRGWDWRRGISASTTGHDVLRILRLGLAKNLAKAWLREVDGNMQ